MSSAAPLPFTIHGRPAPGRRIVNDGYPRWRDGVEVGTARPDLDGFRFSPSLRTRIVDGDTNPATTSTRQLPGRPLAGEDYQNTSDEDVNDTYDTLRHRAGPASHGSDKKDSRPNPSNRWFTSGYALCWLTPCRFRRIRQPARTSVDTSA
jgi:hypothetical protein